MAKKSMKLKKSLNKRIKQFSGLRGVDHGAHPRSSYGVKGEDRGAHPSRR